MNQGTELKRGDRRRGEVRERGRGSVFGQAGQRKGVCRPPDSDGIRDIRSADVRTSERMLVRTCRCADGGTCILWDITSF